MQHSKWKGTTDGTPWMLRSLTASLRVLPLWFVYMGMAFVIPFYVLFGPGFAAMYRYFRQRRGHGALRAVWSVVVNEFTFGMVIIDRFAYYAGKRFKCEVENNGLFLDLCDKPGGFMVLSSHIGNFELCGYSMRGCPKRFNSLVFSGEKAEVKRGRNGAMTEGGIRLVPVEDDMSHIFTLSNALRDGEIVSMSGDRVFGSNKTICCRFMGGEAEFPKGPFALAQAREVPVLSIFVMKTGIYSYRVLVQRVEGGSAAQLAQNFAIQLEGVLKQHPYQWFNYYEFWKR